MRSSLLVGVAGFVLGGVLTAVSLQSSGATPASSGDIAELRNEVARLGGAIARTERLAIARVSAAATAPRLVAEQGRGPDASGACTPDANAQEAAGPGDGTEIGESPALTRDSDSVRDALALVESAEATGEWRREDVLALQEQLLDLAPEEQIEVTESLVLALNEGRLRLPEGVISAF
jgi:hypothetical protein